MNDELSVKQTLSANSKQHTVALRRNVASVNSLISSVLDLAFCRSFLSCRSFITQFKEILQAPLID